MKEKRRSGTLLSKKRIMKDAVPGKEKDIWIDWLPGGKRIIDE
ncbi:hypothetical protein [Anaerostipes caccae]|jgi:bla regulator protein BlaR1|nr:hypothetical protein [Anaerostipes caccae]